MSISILRTLAATASELLDLPLKGNFPPRVDLSLNNLHNTGPRPFDRKELQAFIESRRQATGSPVVWGGYLEQRLIYNSSPIFHTGRHPRNIHLGLDFWTASGIGVHAPVAGTVHSFQDNANFGDYGPTVILRHEVPGLVFHTLYGHLSRHSLEGLSEGMAIQKGATVGAIGNDVENGEWPPHLHFQVIIDLQGYKGDYPGVCALEEVKQCSENCPDPRFLLGI